MRWIITVDHISARVSAALGEPPTTYADKKIGAERTWRDAYKAAPEGFKPLMLKEFKAEMTEEFRLYDDDGELYYEGLCKDLDLQADDSAFAPLDWAAIDAGCTKMTYRKIGAAVWKTL